MGAPLILAFDTSAPRCVAAVLAGKMTLAHAEEPMPKGQAERLLVLCQELLDEANVSQHELAAIGVGTGPGNFTGVRIAISAARGLAFGLGIPAVGVSQFDALRYGTEEPCACAVDARRGDVYLQRFGTENPIGTPALFPLTNMPDFEGPLIGVNGQSACYPLPVAIGRIAADRFRKTVDRPAPLYLRPADAAPARDAAPKILT